MHRLRDGLKLLLGTFFLCLFFVSQKLHVALNQHNYMAYFTKAFVETAKETVGKSICVFVLFFRCALYEKHEKATT